MPDDIRHVVFLTSGPLWPRWLDRAAMKFRDQVGVTKISHVFPNHAGPSRGQRDTWAGKALLYLEARAYNPAGTDALEPVSKDGVETVEIDGADDLRDYAQDWSKCVVICEGDIPEALLDGLRQSGDTQILRISETWSDGVPAMAGRAMLEGTGYVEVTVHDVSVPVNSRRLCRSFSQVSPLALNQSIHRHFFKLAAFPTRALLGPVDVPAPTPDPTRPLSAGEVWRLMAAQLGRRVAKKLNGSEDRAWALVLGKGPPAPDAPPELGDMQVIDPGPGRLWADPCLAQHGDRCYLFFEELVFGEDRGKILAAEVDHSGLLETPKEVLSEPFHLSYPQVFRHGDKWYMIPETGDTGRVELYVADAFPYNWRHERTLLDGCRLFDATILNHDGLYWMFGTVAEPGASDYDELCVFFSPDPVNGPWSPHPLNPIVSDVRRARPGGRFLSHAGDIYRPSQDSRTRYGFGMAMNVIEELTTETFRERTVWRLSPEAQGSPYRGMHTYNAGGGLFVADVII